jgi:hypothetical protein
MRSIKRIKTDFENFKASSANAGAFCFWTGRIEFQKTAGAAITHEFLSPAPAETPSSHWARQH